jgi:hypothetical protein
MKNTITIGIVFFFFSRGYSQSNAPSVINTAGGASNSGYYQFEWSIGEMALIGQMNSSNGSLIITNGFIQPYILNPGTINTNNFFNGDEIKVFPNPASDYVEINFMTKQKGRITLNFYETSGKIIYSTTVQCYGVDLIHRIPVSQLPNNVYMLHINLDADNGYVSKRGAYKIIKVQ